MTKKIFAVSLIGLLTLSFQLVMQKFVLGANESFVQTDWSGGVDGGATAVHPTNKTGWTKYSSKDANVATAGARLTLSTSTDAITETTDAHFNAGAKTNIDVIGTGTAGAIKLKALTNDSLRSTLGKWASPEPVPYPPGYGASACYPGSGNYIYILRGNYTNHFVRYDVVNKKFSSLAPTPKPVYHGAGLVYPGSGDYIYALRGYGTKHFWRYSITTNTWSALADAPGGIWWGGSITAFDTDTLYVTQGWGQTSFWKYTISTNTWLVRSVTPYSISYGAQLCYPGSGNFIYLTRGGDSTTFYKYDTTLNSWTTAASTPYPVNYSSGQLVSGGDGYIYATFYYYYQPYFVRYSTSADAWTSISSMLPYIPAQGACLVWHSVQNKLYAMAGGGVNTIEMPAFDLATQKWDRFSGPGGYYYGTGYAFIKAGNYIYSVANCNNNNSSYYKKFFRFNLTTEEWENLADLPTYTAYPRSDQLVWTGAGSLYEDYIYWMSSYGADKGKLYRYRISTNTWEYLSICPYTADNYYSTLYYPGVGDIIWVIPGHDATVMYKYSLSANTWTATSPAPLAFYYPRGGIVYPNPSTSDYIYVHRGEDRGDFWRYSVSGDTWTVMASTWTTYPSWHQGQESNLIYPGSGDYIYINRGEFDSSYRYSISSNTWTSINFPFNSRGSAWHYPGRGDFIYILSPPNSFYKYSISGNTYTKLNSMPVAAGGVWLCMPDAAGDVIYSSYSYSFPLFLKYTVSTNTWTSPCYDINSQTYGFHYGSDTLRVGNYIYAMLGGGSRSFYKYDIANETWQFLKATPTPIGYGGYLAYPGSGDFIYATAGNTTTDFYKYSITNDEWTKLADVPQTVSTGACMAAPGDGFIYLLRGGDQANMYKYSIAADFWSNLNNSPRYSTMGTEMIYPGSGSFFYVMMTYDSNNYFYKYNYNTDTWTTLAAFPRQNRGYPSFTYTGGDYIYCLDSEGTNYLYRYSISGNTWVSLCNAPQLMYQEGQLEWGGPSYPDLLYAWGGYAGAWDGYDYGFNGFKYSIADNKWDCPSTHAYNATYRNYEVGGLLTPVFYNGNNYLYNYKNDYDSSWAAIRLFYRLNLETQAWELMASPPTSLDTTYGGDIYYPGSGDFIYAIAGNGTKGFYRYSLSSNTWTSLADTPDTVYYGARLAAGQDGYLYLTRGYSTATFWRYNIATNTWSSSVSAPGGIGYGSDLIYVSKNNSLYCLQGGTYDGEQSGFYKFNLSTQTWSVVASIPSPVERGGALSYPGIGDYIYATSKGRQFLRYSITNDTWEELDPLPNELHYSGDLACGGDGYLYVAEGYRSNQVFLRRYNIFASGEFTSQVIEVGKNAGFGAVSWTDTADNLTNLCKVKIRTSDSSTMSGASDFASYATNGADISNITGVTDTNKYLQYEVELKTTDLASLPEFRDITFNYLYYPLSSSLTSSIYDSTALRNRMMKLSWSQTLPANTDIRFQLRTSADNLTWSNWLGPTGATSVTYDFSTASDYAKSSKIILESGAARIAKDLEDFQYKQPVIIDNTGQAEATDAVTSLSLTSVNSAFWSHIQSDGDDIRFYDPQTSQKLAYNLVYFDYTNKTARISIRIPSIAAGEVKTIYMLYGSASATSESDITVSAVPLTGLVGYWKFDEGSGTTVADSSPIGTNTGTLVNSPTWIDGRDGYGKALSFNGSNQYVDVGTVINASLGSLPISVSFWIKLPSYIDGNWRVPIANTWWGGSPGVCAMIYSNQQFIMSVNGSECTSPRTSWNITTDTWHHIVYTVTPTQAKLYIDNSLKQVFSGYWSLSVSSNPLRFGYPYNYSWFWGSMDDVAIYNRELTQDDVNALYLTTSSFKGSVYIPIPEESATSPTLGASWPYREVITLTNTGTAKTNYVVGISLDNSHTGFWQHVRQDGVDDGGDIRIVDSDNTTLIAYSIVSFNKTAKTATISAKVPSIPVGTKNIYLYYGNPAATNASDPTVRGVPATGLVGYWKFDEGSGTTAADSSGNNRTVKLTGSPTWTTGKYGNGITFGSGQYGSIEEIAINTTWTVAAWVKFPLPTTSDGWRTLFLRLGGYYHRIIWDSSGNLGSYNNGFYSSGYNTNSLSAGWHHIAAVASGGSTTQYFVDGTAVGTSSTVVSQGFSCIGNNNGNEQIGTIDEAVVYNRALSASEITQLFQSTGIADTSLISFSYPETANTYSITGSYYTDNLVIQPITGAFYNNDLVEFLETATKPTGTEIKYQVSPNGYEWYWWNGTAWALITGGYSQANTAAEVNTNLAAFMTQIASSGEFIYRAYLNSATGAATPLLDNINININFANTFYLNYLGIEGINSIHTDIANDRYFQYKITLYSSGEDTPILDDVTIEYTTPYLTLTSPLGGEVWQIGSIQNITWNYGGLTNVANGVQDENVKIEYSTDGGSTWKTESASSPNTGTYQWTVDDDHTTQARIKVSSLGWPVISTESTSNFRIVGSVSLTRPSGGERWLVGSIENITWTSSGTMPNVKIEYSTDNGASWSPVIESEGAVNDGIVTNDGAFSWTIPDQITSASTCLVRVSDSVDANTVSTLATPFRIIGAFNVTYPTLNAALIPEAVYDVTWTTIGTIPQVNLTYSINSGASWMDMAGSVGQVTTVSNTGSYSWTVPNPLSDTSILRVADKNDSTVYADSPNFYIRGFQISSPNGEEEWEFGFAHTITWTSGGIIQTPIDIYLSLDGGATYPYWITRRTVNSSSYNWTISGMDMNGATYSASDSCRIKIVDAGSRVDVSDSNFKLAANPAITVTEPTSSSQWLPGSTNNITWATAGRVSTDIAIEYTVDGGATWTAVSPAPTSAQIADKSYPWTLPNFNGLSLPANLQVRVRETTLPTRDTQSLVSGVSATGAQVVSPIFTITSPTSSTIWVAGDVSRAITWTREGALIDNLKLDYSVDGGTNWTNIVTFTQAQHDGSYNWTNIPAEAVGDSVLIRISDSRAPSVVTDNSEAFKILSHQRIALTAPTGGEQLIQGDSYNITWHWDGQATTDALKLQLSSDGGQTWPEYAPYLIADQIPNSPTSYLWVVPSTINTTTAKIRIYDVGDPLVTSTTDNFAITIPQINITAPAAGSQWYATGVYNITWTTVGSVSNSLKIEYRLSANGGTTWGNWQTITAATTPAEAAAHSKAWLVPDNAGQTAQVRITDNNRTIVTATSGNFSIITPTITITAPTGSETGPNAWVVGTQHDIAWTTTGGAQDAISSLRIQYTTDGSVFTTIATITDSVTLQADAGSYTWTIPDAVSATARIKIFDPARPATIATSNQFEIKAPSVTIIAPNGGESWIIGTNHEITWYSVGGIILPLKLYYSDNGINYVQIAEFDGVNDGSFIWTVPDAYSAGLAKIKLTDSYTPTPRSDTSDGSFTIAYPVITPITPTILLSESEVATLSWASEGALVGPYLKVEWSTDDFATSTIISQTVLKADTSVQWTIPAAAVSANCKFRVTDLGRTQSWGKSGAFTVLPAPSITVTAPTTANVGTDAWRIGKEYDITWTSNNGKISNDLRLQYSLDSGVTWTSIVAGGEANDGSFAWTVPTSAFASVTSKVKIYDNTPWKSGTNLSVESDVFEIAIPRITITSPAGGEHWAVGDSAPITWTSEGFINNNLSIQYTIDGAAYYSVASSEVNDGSFTWTVPDVGATSLAKIKIIDASSNYDGAQVTDISNAFNIIATPTITVTAPNGGEEYVLGDTLPITWTSRGLQVQNVKIEYSANNFTTKSTIVASTPNNGSYSWLIPETALSGSTIKVRVSMVGNVSVYDDSDATFRIRGGFTITEPTANQRFIVGKRETVTWTTRGTIANVVVKYTSDSTATPVTWTTIASSTTNTGSYSFAVPAPRVTTAKAKLRIEDATDSTVYAESAAFRADYYTITWRVLDYDTNAPLQLLSVRDDVWVDQNKTITSPVSYDYPYGSYTTFWSKDGYIERSLEWTADNDKTVTVALENQLTATMQWHVGLSTSYTASSDTLKARCWLERRGKLIGTVETDLIDLQWAKLEVFDAGTPLWSYTETTNDGLGSYAFTWANTGLAAGKNYFVKATISYRDSTYTSGSTIDVTSAKDQQATRALVEAEAIKTAAIKTAVESTLPAQITTAKTEIMTDTGKILTATETTIPAKIEEAKTELTDITKSEILNRENTIRSGQTLTVRYRTYTGLSPVLDIYDANNIKRVSSAVMSEIGGTGVYEYDVKFLTSWGTGDYTIVCSESSKGTMDAMTITVLKTDIEQVYSQISAILGTTAGISGLKSVADTLNSQFNVIESALSKVGKDLVKEVKDAASSATALESVYTQLSSVAKQIKELTGTSGINLQKLYEVSSDKKTDLQYLKNKTQELKAAMEINQKMVENIANKPVTQTWYEYK